MSIIKVINTKQLLRCILNEPQKPCTTRNQKPQPDYRLVLFVGVDGVLDEFVLLGDSLGHVALFSYNWQFCSSGCGSLLTFVTTI